MKFERIDSKARVWTVKRGHDGKLKGELDTQLLASLYPGLSQEDIAVIAQGTAEIAQTRLW
jgi:hypothetical protein